MSKFSQAASDAFHDTFPAAYMGTRKASQQPSIGPRERVPFYDQQINQLNNMFAGQEGGGPLVALAYLRAMHQLQKGAMAPEDVQRLALMPSLEGIGMAMAGREEARTSPFAATGGLNAPQTAFDYAHSRLLEQNSYGKVGQKYWGPMIDVASPIREIKNQAAQEQARKLATKAFVHSFREKSSIPAATVLDAAFSTIEKHGPVVRRAIPESVKKKLAYDKRAYLHLMAGSGEPLNVTMDPEVVKTIKDAQFSAVPMTKRPAPNSSYFYKRSAYDVMPLRSIARETGIRPSKWYRVMDTDITTAVPGVVDAIGADSPRAMLKGSPLTRYLHTWGKHYMTTTPEEIIVGDKYGFFPKVPVVNSTGVDEAALGMVEPGLLPKEMRRAVLRERLSDDTDSGINLNGLLQILGNMYGTPYNIYSRIPK